MADLHKRQRPLGGRWLTRVALVVLLLLIAGSAFAFRLVKPVEKQGETTAKVESSVRRAATAQGANVSQVRCDESSRNEWKCTVRLTDGRMVTASAEWHAAGRVLGVAVNLGSR